MSATRGAGLAMTMRVASTALLTAGFLAIGAHGALVRKGQRTKDKGHTAWVQMGMEAAFLHERPAVTPNLHPGP